MVSLSLVQRLATYPDIKMRGTFLLKTLIVYCLLFLGYAQQQQGLLRDLLRGIGEEKPLLIAYVLSRAGTSASAVLMQPVLWDQRDQAKAR